MELIYEWLLLHVGNEANYYTILNCQRDTTPEGIHYLRVMGRLREFRVINLLIYSEQATDLSVTKKEQESGAEQSHLLSVTSPQQVIEYLTTGKADISASNSKADADTFYISLVTPVGDAGEITFPPENQ